MLTNHEAGSNKAVGNQNEQLFLDDPNVNISLNRIHTNPADTATPMPSISIVIPTLNEEKNLPFVLPKLPAFVSEVILVDGLSSDNTRGVARSLRPEIKIVEQSKRGKGAALAAGFSAASGDIIVMMDADGSTNPAEIRLFIEALLNGADYAKGTRFIKPGGSNDLTWLRRFGNCALNLLVNRLFGSNFTDLCYGYNAFKKDCLDHISIDSTGFEVETELNIRAHKAGLKIVEVPSYERDRIYGESNLNAVRDGLRVLKTILSEFLNRNNVITKKLQPEAQIGNAGQMQG